MTVMGIAEEVQYEVLSIVAGILHMGNIVFREHNNYAQVADNESKWRQVSGGFYVLGSQSHEIKTVHSD